MKKGNGKGGGSKQKDKGKIKSSADKWFNTRYERSGPTGPRGKVTRVHTEVPKIDRLQKKESVKNFREGFDNPDTILNERHKASVHCINEQRAKQGKPVITTPANPEPASARRCAYIIASEMKAYAAWAKRWEKSREKSELAYYSKLDYRKEKAKEYSAVEHKPELVGPPKPSTLPQPRAANGYSFATNKRKVTRCNIEPPRSVMTPQQLETAARNDPSFAPSVADVKWWINNYAPHDWPEIIREHTYYMDSGYRPDKQKILGTTANVLNQDYESLEQDHYRLQIDWWEYQMETEERIDNQNQYISALEKENQDLKQALKVAELHGVTSGQQAKDETPLSIKKLATLFTVFKSQWNDNPLDAFCRIHKVDKQTRVELRALFDSQCEQRLAVSSERAVYRRWASNKVYRKPRSALRVMKELRSLRRLGNHAGYASWLQKHAPSQEYKELCSKRKVINTLRYERGVFAKWATTNKDSLCNKGINNRVAVLLAQDEQVVKDLMSTKKYKALKWLIDVATIEVNPWERKRQAEKKKHSAAMKRKSLKQKKVQASRIKRQQEQEFEKQEQLDRIKEAYRIAH